MNFDVEKCTENKFKDVYYLYKYYREELRSIRPDLEKGCEELDKEFKDDFYSMLSKDKTLCIVGMDNENIIGFSISYPMKTLPSKEYIKREYAFLDSLYVLPQYRRMGIATLLLSQTKKYYVANGIEKMELYVLHNNKAINTYLKNGFLVQSYRMELDIKKSLANV